MAPTKNTKISGEIGTGPLKVGADYRLEIYQEIVKLEDGESKIIPLADGQGIIIATRFGDRITAVTKLFVRDGIFGKGVITDTLEMNDGGVFDNGRKI